MVQILAIQSRLDVKKIAEFSPTVSSAFWFISVSALVERSLEFESGNLSSGPCSMFFPEG